MHRGDRGDLVGLRDLADQRARQAVAAGAEGRAGDEQVGLEPNELGGDRTRGLVPALADEVVATDQRGLDARLVAERLLQGAARTDGAGLCRHADVGLILAADTTEELVHVVHDAQRTTHGAPPGWILTEMLESLSRFAPRG